MSPAAERRGRRAPQPAVPRGDAGLPTRRILLVDDHELVRAALAGALRRQKGFEVVAQASSADEALLAAARCKPDILVMDIDMPGMICFDAVAKMRPALPGLRVIFLSAFFHDHYIEQALRVGAAGYVVKGGPLGVLFEALRTVANGGSYFAEEVRSRIDGADGRPTRASSLTPREIEVLRYLARGLSKKEIGRTMELSVKTVEHHCASVMRKLDIHDRVELARYAIREGLAEA